MAETWRQLLRRQHGVFTIEQAIGHGVSRVALRDREQAGLYTMVAPHTMYVGGDIVLPRLALLWRAVLTLDSALLSHATAAQLWGLRVPDCTEIHVTVPRANWAPRRDMSIHTVLPQYRCDATTREGLPVTTLERSIVDAFGVLDREDDRRTLVADAFRQRRTSAARLSAAILAKPQVRRRAELIAVTEFAAGGSHSAGEMKLYAFLQRWAFPPAQRQYLPELPRARRYVDCALPAYRIALEYDGRHHLSDAQRHDDQLRDELLRRLQWVTIRVSNRRLRDEIRLAEDVWANILEQSARMRIAPPPRPVAPTA